MTQIPLLTLVAGVGVGAHRGFDRSSIATNIFTISWVSESRSARATINHKRDGSDGVI